MKISKDLASELLHRRLNGFHKRYPKIHNQILVQTDFLRAGALLKQRLFHITNKSASAPNCASCGGEVAFVNFELRYRSFCSKKCAANSEITKKNREASFLIRLGVKHPWNSRVVQEKIEKTNLIKYGARRPCQNPNIIKKLKKTNIEKLGVENPSTYKIKDVLRLLNDRDFLIKEYQNSNNTIEDLAKKLNCSRMTVYNYLIKNSVPIKPKGIFSSKALKWLSRLETVHNVRIQKYSDGGEYKIPNCRLLADGYCEETNTVYEFYGDAFHGNLKRYGPNVRCHPFDKSKTASQLSKETLDRENFIRSLGFKVVSIWESDWDELVKNEQIN